MQRRVVKKHAVGILTVIAERLAVIGDNHDDRAVAGCLDHSSRSRSTAAISPS
jgi:hypothetical protein